MEESNDGVQWHTFAGGAINRLLAAGLEAMTKQRWLAGNLSVRSKEATFGAASDAVSSLRTIDWERTAREAAHRLTRTPLSKFQPCLPQDAEDRLLADRLLDLPGTVQFVVSTRIVAVAAGGRQGLRLSDPATLGPVAVLIPLALPGEVRAPRNPIEWIDSVAALRAVCVHWANEEVVALDVETMLDFGTLCLMQIATRERTYLLDPFMVADLSPLSAVLGAHKPVKVIHNARFERRVLAAVGLELEGVFDTMEASKRAHGKDILGGHGLASLCERELGVRLDKSAQTSNWARRPLDGDQLRYAALDAEILLDLYGRFSKS